MSRVDAEQAAPWQQWQSLHQAAGNLGYRTTALPLLHNAVICTRAAERAASGQRKPVAPHGTSPAYMKHKYKSVFADQAMELINSLVLRMLFLGEAPFAAVL